MTNMLAGTIVMQSIRLPTHVNRERDGGAAISSCGQVIVSLIKTAANCNFNATHMTSYFNPMHGSSESKECD